MSTPPDLAPRLLPPLVTSTLILSCLIVFGWQWSLGPADRQLATYGLGAIPAVLFERQVLAPTVDWVPSQFTPLTYIFLHGDSMHLVSNMFCLWLFGHQTEDAMGHGRFLIFFLLAGLAAVLVQALVQPGSGIPVIGASGAVAGVLGAYLLLYPNGRVHLILPWRSGLRVARLPAHAMLAAWMVIQLLGAFGFTLGQGGFAFASHLGGFAAGAALVTVFRRRGIRLLNPDVFRF